MVPVFRRTNGARVLTAHLYLRRLRRRSGVVACTVTLLALALPVPGSLCAATTRPIPAHAIAGWLDWNIADAVREVVGPEGAQVFAEWEREEDRVHLGSVLVMTSLAVDLGTVANGRLGLHFDPDNLAIESVTLDLDEPISLATIEEYFGVHFELRYCKAAFEDAVLESPMIETSADEATSAVAVLQSHRLVAVMPKVDGRVRWLSWMAKDEDLEGCG